MTGRALLELVDGIYEAAIEPSHWRVVVKRLSAALGGPAVAMTLGLPRLERSVHHFGVHLSVESIPVVALHMQQGLPWGDPLHPRWRGRFGRGAECVPDETIAATALYRDWMAPLGLAPAGPVGTPSATCRM